MVIIGHSERRQYHAESNKMVNQKAKLALSKGLLPIICVGETLEEKKSNKTINVITKQIKESLKDITADRIVNTTIAYEPVWAIGTGNTATLEAQKVHTLIRELLAFQYKKETAEKIIIQYGGSVIPENSKRYLKQKDIDGALVGGASLNIDSFVSLIANSL